MSLPIHIALVAEGVQVSISQLTKVASALSKQVQNDFQPIWNTAATVDAFAHLEDVPVDYWPIIVMKDVQGAAGYHQDKNGQPYSVVEYGNQWSITASHECLEMLADPFGRRLKSGDLPDQAVKLGLKQGRVRFLVEVCDPSESGQFGYHVNGILVSDFYTPHFFDPVASPGVRYSFTGKIDAPRKILQDGYISWQDLTSKHWFQLRMFADESSKKIPHVIDLTNDTTFEKLKMSESLRGAIDRVTPSPQYAAVMTAPALESAQRTQDVAEESQIMRATELRAEVASHFEAPETNPPKRRTKGG